MISDYLYQRQADYEFLLEGGLKADRIYNCEKTAVYIIEKILSSMQEKKDVSLSSLIHLFSSPLYS